MLHPCKNFFLLVNVDLLILKQREYQVASCHIIGNTLTHMHVHTHTHAATLSLVEAQQRDFIVAGLGSLIGGGTMYLNDSGEA